MGDYGYSQEFFGNGDSMELFGEEFIEMLGIYGIIMLFSFAVSLVLYILQGIGILKMSKSLGIKGGWMIFIPVLANFALGRVAQKYEKQNGKKSASFGTVLLILGSITIIFSVAYIVYAVGWIIEVIPQLMNTAAGVTMSEESAMSMLTSAIGLLMIAVVFLGFYIAYIVIYYIALWRIFAVFNYHTATLFLVLSIFFSFLAPIFIFVMRNNIPKVTYAERLGIENTDNISSFPINE